MQFALLGTWAHLRRFRIFSGIPRYIQEYLQISSAIIFAIVLVWTNYLAIVWFCCGQAFVWVAFWFYKKFHAWNFQRNNAFGIVNIQAFIGCDRSMV